MQKLLSILLIAFSFQSCKSQNKDVSLNDLEFNSIFAENKKDSTNIYCLLGTGFFRAPCSENSDELIKNWLQNNQDAKVVIVSILANENPNVNYCWIIDKNGQTINEYLIRNGCFPGGTMLRPNTYREMSKQEKKLYDGQKPNILVQVDKKSYDEFIEKIKLAETYARENKLGIWKDK